MTDIVERLRDWQDYEPVKMFGGEILKDIREAADEIERLRSDTMKPWNYDDRCKSVALHVLGQSAPEHAVKMLAQHLQDAIESWVGEHPLVGKVRKP